MEGMTFSLPPGGIVGIIGPNGAGKTTLFRMITGQEKPDSGTFRIGETVKLAYVDQSRNDLDPNKTIWEVITDGLEVDPAWKEAGQLTVPMSHALISQAATSRKRFRCSPEVKETASICRRMLKEEANVLLLG